MEEGATNVRDIKLNMDRYDSACQEYSDDALVEIFELGLRVKKSASSYKKYSDDEIVKIFEMGLRVMESVSLTLGVNSKFVEDALDSQMKLVQESVERIEQQVNEKVKRVQEEVTQAVDSNMKNFTKNVDDLKEDVAKKVLPLDQLNRSISDSETRVSQMVGECTKKVDSICNSLERPKVKGTVGEREVINILKDRFPTFTVADVSTKPRSGDILVETPRQHRIMIEVKNRETSNVPRNEIDRFKKNLASSPYVKVGILFSMKSGIASKASDGRFQVKFDVEKNQYQIYVPNAGKEEALIVWNVLLADELAQALHGELRASQVQNLEQLYEEFKESKDHEKTCRSNLDSLEKSAKSLRESLDFVLETVNKTRNKLKKLLDPNAAAV